MPRVYNKNLLGRLFEGAGEGLKAYGTISTANKFRDFLNSSNDPIFQALGKSVNPITGEIPKFASDVLGYYGGLQKNEALLNRMVYQQQLADDRAEARDARTYQRQLDLANLQEQQLRERDVLKDFERIPDKKDPTRTLTSNFEVEYGIDPRTINPADRARLAKAAAQGKDFTKAIKQKGVSASEGFLGFGAKEAQPTIFDFDLLQ